MGAAKVTHAAVSLAVLVAALLIISWIMATQAGVDMSIVDYVAAVFWPLKF